MLLRTLTPISLLLLLFSTGCILVGVERASKSGPGTSLTISSHTTGDATIGVQSLAVVWSSGERDVAMLACLNYVENAAKNKWFSDNCLIVMGPSVGLLADNREAQARVELLIDKGVKVQADSESAEVYNVTDRLKELGIDVKPMSMPLTNMLKASNTRVITF